jgi:hypothetical protein
MTDVATRNRKRGTGYPAAERGRFDFERPDGADVSLTTLAPERPWADVAPADIDARIGALLIEQVRPRQMLERLDRDRKRYDVSFAAGYLQQDAYDRIIAGDTAQRAEQQAILDRTDAELAVLDDEFDARGGWARYYLVQNANGHVHTSRSCSTCTSTTQYGWLTEQSGATEDEIVALAQDQACTVCLPSAPVADPDRPRPGSLMTAKQRAEKERKDAADAARAQRAAASAAKATAAGISHPDGEPLTDYFSGRPLATDRAAQISATDYLHQYGRPGGWVRNVPTDRLLTEATRRAAESTQWDGEPEGQFEARKHRAYEHVHQFVRTLEALALKRGLDVNALRSELQKKADKRK